MNTEEAVKMFGDEVKKVFPHHLLIAWYPSGQWSINCDNIRIDHMVCLMEWLDKKIVEQNLTMGTRYRLYRVWGRSRWDAFRLAVFRP
jgi:hypothetical protein